MTVASRNYWLRNNRQVWEDRAVISFCFDCRCNSAGKETIQQVGSILPKSDTRYHLPSREEKRNSLPKKCGKRPPPLWCSYGTHIISHPFWFVKGKKGIIMPSYEKSKASGLWSCRFREVDPLTGETHNKRLSGYRTKREAQYGYEDHIKAREQQIEQLQAQRRAEEEQKKRDPNEMLFDDLLADYMTFTQRRVKETTFYDMQSKINNRLQPYFAGKHMREITPKLVSDWIEGIDYSYKSKAWIFSTLVSIYKYGGRYHDITDIMYKVDRPKNMQPKKEMRIWSPEQFAAFSACMDKEEYRLYFTTLYVTGCRRGEGLALTWNDITPRSMRINKSISTKTARGAYVVTTPKNDGSNRNITVPDYLTHALSAHRTAQREQYGDTWHADMYVFGGERPLPPSTADRYFKAAIDRAGVPPIRVHDLRHSCASLLISRGISIVAVSRQLGHKDVEQTLNTYAHMLPDDTTAIYNALDSLGTLLAK